MVTSRNLNAQFFEDASAVFIKPIASVCVCGCPFGTACIKEPAEINAQPPGTCPGAAKYDDAE
jgi:hypothetical protein